MSNTTGELGSEWGYSLPEVGFLKQDSIAESPDDVALVDVLLDQGKLHDLCLQAVNLYGEEDSTIDSQLRLKRAMNYVCAACEVPDLDDEDVAELWCGKLNFSEFLMVAREILLSFNRVLSQDIAAATDDDEPDHNSTEDM